MGYQKYFHVLGIFVLLGAGLAINADAMEGKRELKGIEPNRVKEVAAMLSEKPIGFGEPISNRDAWERMGKLKVSKESIEAAEKTITQTPDFGDDVLTDFSKTGRRDEYDKHVIIFYNGFTNVVWAECVENKGRFLPFIEKMIKGLCAAKTWMHPAHDRNLRYFRGELKSIDLMVAHFGFELAETDYLLGDKLSAETRAMIRREVKARVFDVFHEILAKSKKSEQYWIDNMTNNWAAVCYCGVLGASQVLIEDRDERAFFAAEIEHYIMRNYIERGFDNEGWCEEGIGYWDYGFTHFIMLSEVLNKATGGKIDLMADAKVRKIAEFPWRTELLAGIYPSYSDVSYMRKVGPLALEYLCKKYGFGEGWWKGQTGKLSSICRKAIFLFPNSSDKSGMVPGERKFGMRDYYEISGMLVCRPAEMKKDSIAAVIRGGDNGESHNHDDIGAFVVAVGDRMPLTDVGGEVYTLKTFSDKRYESGVLNSYGHSVPIVAGKLQREGRDAKAKVLSHEFTDKRDRIVYDLKGAYDVKGLLKLERSFTYLRGEKESLEVVDEVSFKKAKEFGTAIMTMGKCEVEGGTIVVTDGDYGAKVDVEASGGYEINVEKIAAEVHDPNLGIPTRIGINMKEPVKDAKIKMIIKGFSRN